MTLPRYQRNLSAKLFNLIFKTGRTVKSPVFLVKILKNDLAYPRGAVVVPKSVSLKAVVRNKIKRTVSESLKKIFHGRDLTVDVIVITHPAIKEKSFSEIYQSLLEIFKKANIVE